MNFVSEDIMEYCESHSKPASPVLKELERETHLKVLMPQMIAGPLQGEFLRFISMMIKPRSILEIGTFTGYSAICLSAGLQESGILHTIEVNEELAEMINRHIGKAGLAEKIKVHFGNALELIRGMKEEFDLVYIDADKENYSAYYDLVFNKLKKGGYILADNALWSGKVLSDDNDSETSGIRDFNQKVKNDRRVDNILLPLRDGIMIIKKL